mmetsp:Transcript_50306/g.80106  ORF Transcript_50306/g.80106 Transcript_50306/m.80106 type:complete len:271 (+) Transcript_50306:519-1331(+)
MTRHSIIATVFCVHCMSLQFPIERCMSHALWHYRSLHRIRQCHRIERIRRSDINGWEKHDKPRDDSRPHRLRSGIPKAHEAAPSQSARTLGVRSVVQRDSDTAANIHGGTDCDRSKPQVVLFVRSILQRQRLNDIRDAILIPKRKRSDRDHIRHAGPFPGSGATGIRADGRQCELVRFSIVRPRRVNEANRGEHHQGDDEDSGRGGKHLDRFLLCEVHQGDDERPHPEYTDIQRVQCATLCGALYFVFHVAGNGDARYSDIASERDAKQR